ncbi:tellurite resistance TerB family protein [Pikeienuella piscinae]|uniref:Tellurite resistance TerB family protein n=1 Tax=Pikeienuella piscinae TaxID=2748098 RepID=A0A7L5BV28_9RHOB|nr:tellurite resistance TerB family protein [Pikeienuella piscinae]QIE55562.1 tellurite resistance TerB family protein [Pikeienuella piscinae]
MSTVLSPQDALVAVMIATSAADEVQSTEELLTIDRIIDALPAFKDYDKDRVRSVNDIVRDLFAEEDGIDALVGLVAEALPDRFHETAYALACDIAAADGKVKLTEMRMLEILRHDLAVGRLASAAIERGARARHQSF